MLTRCRSSPAKKASIPMTRAAFSTSVTAAVLAAPMVPVVARGRRLGQREARRRAAPEGLAAPRCAHTAASHTPALRP